MERYRSVRGALTTSGDSDGTFTVHWTIEKTVGETTVEGTSDWTFKSTKSSGRPSVALDLCNTPDAFGK